MQLQRIREADTAVRWQHDDDVSECNACRTPLPNNKKKVCLMQPFSLLKRYLERMSSGINC